MSVELSYRSNDLVTPVNLSKGEFIFIFDYIAIEKDTEKTLEETNFHLIFGIENRDNPSSSTTFKITNTSASETGKGYRFNEDINYTLKKKTQLVEDTFFNDELYFFDGEPYKLLSSDDKVADNFKIVNGKTYIKTPKYSLVTFNNASYIKRLNEVNSQGHSIRPMEVRWTSTTDAPEIEYYVDKYNIFDANLSHTYKIVVGESGKVINLWHQNKDGIFENIKTFSFTNSMENAFITLKINEELKDRLSNLRFSFFESDVV